MTESRQILALSFDADQTLWDFEGVQQKALKAVVEELERRGYSAPGSVSVEDLRRTRTEVARSAESAALSIEQIRTRSFELVLERLGHPDASWKANEIAEVFFEIRLSQIELFPDVAVSLERLRRRYRIGLLSNGNTDVDRGGLPGVFDAICFGSTLGYCKPDPRAFTTIADLLGVDVASLAHIGDEPADVQGAKAAGAVSVFMNRKNDDPEFGSSADYEVADMRQLESLLESLRSP